MSIEGQGHFLTIYFPGFVCFVLYQAKISDERLQDYWSSGLDTFHKVIWKALGVPQSITQPITNIKRKSKVFRTIELRVTDSREIGSLSLFLSLSLSLYLGKLSVQAFSLTC